MVIAFEAFRDGGGLPEWMQNPLKNEGFPVISFSGWVGDGGRGGGSVQNDKPFSCWTQEPPLCGSRKREGLFAPKMGQKVALRAVAVGTLRVHKTPGSPCGATGGHKTVTPPGYGKGICKSSHSGGHNILSRGAAERIRPGVERSGTPGASENSDKPGTGGRKTSLFLPPVSGLSVFCPDRGLRCACPWLYSCAASRLGPATCHAGAVFEMP
jgi:hypothetical protein